MAPPCSGGEAAFFRHAGCQRVLVAFTLLVDFAPEPILPASGYEAALCWLPLPSLESAEEVLSEQVLHATDCSDSRRLRADPSPVSAA